MRENLQFTRDINNDIMVFFARNYREFQYFVCLAGFCGIFGFFTMTDC